MCGRMATLLPHDAMAQLFGAAMANDLPDVPNYNVCPTLSVAVVTSETTVRRLRPMRWGFIPHWYKAANGGPLLINARAETIAEKPAFKAACRARRCLIPAAGFYEWERPEGGEKLPWFVQRADGAPMVFAGIWQDWEGDGQRLTTCAVVTTEATGEIARIHHRSPVILEEGDWGKWLGEEGHGAALLMQPPAEGVVRTYRVGKAVNSNRASGPELLEPLED